MTSFIQICLCVLAVQCLGSITCNPLAEISFKRNFDFLLKPIPFKPLAFFKEKWSPFGKFGVKHGIAKRDLDQMKTINNITPIPIAMERFTRLPAQVYELEPPGEVPVPISGPYPGLGIAPVIPPVGIRPVPARPLPRVVLITPPPPPKINALPPSGGGLNTDIAQNELINDYIKTVEQAGVNQEEKVVTPIAVNTLTPEKPKDDVTLLGKEETTNPFVRGSRLALYFGNILLDVFAQFLGSPRTNIINQ